MNWLALATCLNAITSATRKSANGMKAITPSSATGIARNEVAASGSPKIDGRQHEREKAAEERVAQREQRRAEDAVDGAVGADEEALDRARDQFLAHAPGHQAQREGQDLDDHQADDHEAEVAARGVNRLGGEQTADVVEESDREQRAEKLRDELRAVADEQDRVAAHDPPHGVAPRSHCTRSRRPSSSV